MIHQSSMDVHTNEDENKKIVLVKTFLSKPFFKQTYEWPCYHWEYSVLMQKKRNILPSKLFSLQRGILMKNVFWMVCLNLSVGHTRLMGVIEIYIAEKSFSRKSSFLQKNFWRTMLSVGVQKPGHRKKYMYLGPFTNKESLSKMKKFFKKVLLNLSMGYTGTIQVVKIQFSVKLIVLINFFMNNFSEHHSYQWGDKGPMIEKKNYILEKIFLPWCLFSSKKVDCFGMIHQWGYTEMMSKTKIKTYINFF